MADTTEHDTTSRRKLLKTTGVLAASGFAAGCNTGGSSSEETPNSDTLTTAGTPTDTSNGNSGESFQGTIGQGGFDIGTIPHTAAVRELLPANTNERFTGSIKNIVSSNLQISSMLSGDIDVFSGSYNPLVQGQLAGNDFRIIGIKVAGTDYVMAVRNSVNSYQDFADKDLKFAIANPGELSHLQPVGVFRKEGVDPKKVNFVQIGGSSARTQALATGNVDGAGIHFGQLTRLKNSSEANVKSLGEVREYFPGFFENVIAVQAQWLENQRHEEFIQSYMNSVVEAHKKATEDFNFLHSNMEQYQAQPLNEEDTRSSWELMKEINRWPHKKDQFSKSALEGVHEMLAGADLIDSVDQVPMDKMYEPKYYESAVENL